AGRTEVRILKKTCFSNQNNSNLFIFSTLRFTNRDIADYYNQTQVHYRRWWKLDEAMAVHYGMWEKETASFRDSLINTNRKVAQIAGIRRGERVLDAGCGVGGSAFYLAEKYNCKVTGITLSENQLDFAQKKNRELGLEDKVDFRLDDYNNTSLGKGTIDIIWAIESLTSAPDKARFCKEAHRVLNTKGRIVVADYFRDTSQQDNRGWMKKWQDCWSLAEILSEDNYIKTFANAGFVLRKNVDATANIRPSSKIMYRSYLLGAIPSILYNPPFRNR
ncbi:MAG: class I SAM-dependent methyltransferase, partial [bacterium]